MPSITGFFDLMDARSFASIWYWTLLVLGWTAAGRGALGVPADVIARARQAPDGPPGMALLDWLSLTLPRRQLPPGAGAGMLAAACFGLGALTVLGWRFDLEGARALALLLAPAGVLTLVRLRLVARLAPILAAAQAGALPAPEAAATAARMLGRHRWTTTAIATVAVGTAAVVGTVWGLTHPNGL